MLSREREDRTSNAVPAHRGHAVNHVVVGVGLPRAIDRRVGLVRPGTERKDGKRPGFIGYEEAVFVRDVFLSVNAARVPFGPLSRIPIRLHERAGVLIRPLDEHEVVRGSDSNLHAEIVSINVGWWLACQQCDCKSLEVRVVTSLVRKFTLVPSSDVQTLILSCVWHFLCD